MAELVISFLVSFVLLIVAMSVHEFSHGWMAYKLGDMTAKDAGRLTLNPLAHVDPLWTFILPLILFVSSGGQFIFGAAKPVPINYWVLKNPKRDMIWIGASGPLANLILAFLLAGLMKISHFPSALSFILMNLVAINVVLGVFNLIPIPPLDGSRILMGILPKRIASVYSRIEPFGLFILFILILFGFFTRLIWPAVELILKSLGVAV